MYKAIARKEWDLEVWSCQTGIQRCSEDGSVEKGQQEWYYHALVRSRCRENIRKAFEDGKLSKKLPECSGRILNLIHTDSRIKII